MIWKWWRKRAAHASADRSKRTVVLITRAGCHLCDDAKQLLEDLRRQLGFSLEIVNVDSNPQLVTDYGSCVPVVTVDGKVRFRGQVNRVLFERLFHS